MRKDFGIHAYKISQSLRSLERSFKYKRLSAGIAKDPGGAYIRYFEMTW
jgi:hypothetical protein